MPSPEEPVRLPDGLDRRLGVSDAVLIGLGSMVGAGVFSVWAPAARVAGGGLLIGLTLAALIAYCNATASAQLAAVYPTSGGTYVYGRERLGEWWGFAAGWGFVVGKTASCAAIALTFAAYAVPESRWGQRLIAVVAVIILATLNTRGVTRTARATRVLVVATLLVLGIAVTAILVAGRTGSRQVSGWEWGHGGVYGVLQSAGLLFFAFAGYARIATLAEEVREPERTIPRAIPLALGAAMVVYLVVGLTALLSAGPRRLAASNAPLVEAVQAAGVDRISALIRVGAVLASLGSLLALLAGIGRTGLAMARNGDLPRWLSAIDPVRRVPVRVEAVLTVVVCGLILTTDLRGVIGFSSFGVLVYYGIANAAALTQPPADRRWPRPLHVLGLVGCAVLVVTLPWRSVVAGLVVVAVGLIGRLIAQRR